MPKITQPEIKAKVFASGAEIDGAIKKLMRRHTELSALNSVRYDDPKVKIAVANLVDALREIFGENSPEMERHRYHKIWKGSQVVGESTHSMQTKFQDGIPDTIEIVNGLIEKLKEKRLDFEDAGVTVNAALIEGLVLHPAISQASSNLLRDGHYSNAVFEASKALVNLVKKKAPQIEKDGTALMFAAFHGKPPAIKFNSMTNESECDEQAGIGYLFAGAVLALRNPRGHELWTDTRERAIEYIGLINLLAKKLDEAVC